MAVKDAIDLEFVFSYPLTPVPLSLFHGDGTMNHTDKSKLQHTLESKVADHGTPGRPTCTIIDGCFLLRTMNPTQPATYGGLSRNILSAVLNTSKSTRIDVVFDTYESPSIKDVERTRRGAIHSNITISGPKQLMDGSFMKQLDNHRLSRRLFLYF